MAPGAPIAAYIEKDVLVLGFGLGFCGCQVFGGVAGWVKDVFGGEGAGGGEEQDGCGEAGAKKTVHGKLLLVTLSLAYLPGLLLLQQATGVDSFDLADLEVNWLQAIRFRVWRIRICAKHESGALAPCRSAFQRRI